MSQTKVKYPRTLHLPWSPGKSRDDLVLTSTSHFEGQHIVVTEKRDGENTTIYPFAVHARSLDSAYHPSQSWVRQLQAQIGHEIPTGWRICGENLYAEHSIPYYVTNYFEVFSIWDETNTALSWNATQEWADLLNLLTVPVIFKGEWPGKDFLDELWQDYCQKMDPAFVEGYVVRLAGRFSYDSFSSSVAKFVRPDHVQTDEHWKKNWKPNQLVQS